MKQETLDRLLEARAAKQPARASALAGAAATRRWWSRARRSSARCPTPALLDRPSAQRRDKGATIADRRRAAVHPGLQPAAAPDRGRRGPHRAGPGADREPRRLRRDGGRSAPRVRERCPLSGRRTCAPTGRTRRWRSCGPDARTAVVTLTHDPKLDDPALDLALRSEAFYIAALGSRRTHAARLERLGALGHDAADARPHPRARRPCDRRGQPGRGRALGDGRDDARAAPGAGDRMRFGAICRSPRPKARSWPTRCAPESSSSRRAGGSSAEDIAALRAAGVGSVIAARLGPERRRTRTRPRAWSRRRRPARICASTSRSPAGSTCSPSRRGCWCSIAPGSTA